MTSVRRLYAPAILLAWLAPLGQSAQGERFRIRMVPAPNQVIRFESNQDMAFDALIEGMGLDALKLTGQMTFAGTQRTGKPDARGRLAVEFTYDDAVFAMQTNGAAMPLAGLTTQLKGKTVTYIYGSDGKLADIHLPEELGGDSGRVRQMIQGLSASIPDTTLRIGETVSVPASMSMPIPLPGGSAGKPMNLETRNTFKLVSVRREGGARIATLDQVVNGRMSYNIEVPGSPGGAVIEMRMTGTGKAEVNLDKGFLTSSTSNADMDMNMIMASPNGPATIKITGTVKIVMTGVSRPAH